MYIDTLVENRAKLLKGEENNLEALRKKLRNEILRQADVVLTTLTSCLDGWAPNTIAA